MLDFFCSQFVKLDIFSVFYSRPTTHPSHPTFKNSFSFCRLLYIVLLGRNSLLLLCPIIILFLCNAYYLSCLFWTYYAFLLDYYLMLFLLICDNLFADIIVFIVFTFLFPSKYSGISRYLISSTLSKVYSFLQIFSVYWLFCFPLIHFFFLIIFNPIYTSSRDIFLTSSFIIPFIGFLF